MRRAAGRFLLEAGFWRQNLRTIITLSVIAGLAAVALVPAKLAYSHDHERPDLKARFKSLKSKAGAACCDDGEVPKPCGTWRRAATKFF
jgi:hypothetical protein